MAKRYFSWLAATVALAVAGLSLVSCGRPAADSARPAPEGKHPSAHGGTLNAIVSCENGHAEVKVEGETMKLWFVGGGNDTLKAVRVPDNQIALTVSLPGQDQARTLVLQAAPSELADEKLGDCSHFEGKADWLAGAKTFSATGSVTFRGTKESLRIEYPSGYDPD